MEPGIVYEDAGLAVINKPCGMVVNKAQTVKGMTVQEWFVDKFKIQSTNSQDEGTEFGQKGGVVHRLDKDTSGLMVLAKTPEAYEKLKQQFLERKTEKRYLALVHGEFSEEEGEIVKPVERHPVERKKFTVGEDLSRTAITQWRVVKKYQKEGEKFCLVELAPHTGRTHQLRVHMQYLHHPIVADPLYGFAKKIKTDAAWCPRLFLHAGYLEFTHPATGKRVSFSAELPGELREVLAGMQTD